MIKAIVGANWGDEGKGKITDLCAAEADVVVRYQGGSNAGHTIINEHGKFALHQLPAGVFRRETTNVIANGVALNPEYLLSEIETVNKAGITFNLKISDRAQLLMGYHVLLDVYEEERLAERRFGSTKSGIAPCFADKYSKQGFQLWQVYHDKDLKEKIRHLCAKKNINFKYLYDKEQLDYERVYEEVAALGEKIKGYVCDTGDFLRQALKSGKRVLLEGQLGALRDIDHGIYPYVTSSPTLAGYAAVGAGVPPHAITDIIAVTKAYSSAVGEGPFVSEIFGSEAETLRERGGDEGEYGATTGRPRRVGYFDAVATRYGCDVQGATEAAITCLDVLGYMDEIPVCVGYDLGGRTHGSFVKTTTLYEARPVYTLLPGWKTNIRGITEYSRLPDNARRYVEFIEEKLDVKITYVSTGPKREETIVRG
ncbi:MAG: adenylosuccinate synthase [Clostridiales bacterium]|jgi:adenylosuccinate synthase|nr:adenylosuccinate synthase [Clostridiales bacterium]